MWLWPSLNAPYDITSPILKTNEDCRDLFGYFNLILLLYWLSQYPTRHLIKLVQPFRNRLRILEKSYIQQRVTHNCSTLSVEGLDIELHG